MAEPRLGRGEAADPGCPSVTVVVPAYDREGCVAEALERFLRQRHDPLDVVVEGVCARYRMYRANTTLQSRARRASGPQPHA